MIYAILTAFFWGTMSVVAKISGVPGLWASAILAMGTSIAMTGIIFAGTPIPQNASIVLCLIAGVLNGLGMLAFGEVVSSKLDLSQIIPFTYALIPVVAAVGGFLFLGEIITLTKIAGLAAVVLGVYLLS